MGGFVARVIAPKPKPSPVYAPPVQKEAVKAFLEERKPNFTGR